MTEVNTTANCSVWFSFMQVIAEVTVKRRNNTKTVKFNGFEFVGRRNESIIKHLVWTHDILSQKTQKRFTFDKFTKNIYKKQREKKFKIMPLNALSPVRFPRSSGLTVKNKCARRWLIFREWNSFVYSKSFSLKLFCILKFSSFLVFIRVSCCRIDVDIADHSVVLCTVCSRAYVWSKWINI